MRAARLLFVKTIIRRTYGGLSRHARTKKAAPSRRRLRRDASLGSEWSLGCFDPTRERKAFGVLETVI